MSLYSDFVAFVDSGSKVKYFDDSAKYYPLPQMITKQFEYEFKIYYKCSHRYYVGVSFNKYVREIHAKEFNMVLELAEKREISNIKTNLQLSFDF
ncbi:MAG: hypothetical protein Q7S59_05925 [Sulfurimonas sp.]|nr:hypothetical protein [Sulfurimonas sp.]